MSTDEMHDWARAHGFEMLAVYVPVPLSVLEDDDARVAAAAHVAGMAAEAARRAVIDWPGDA